MSSTDDTTDGSDEITGMPCSKRLCVEMGQEFWSFDGKEDGHSDPYSDFVLVVKTTSASPSRTVSSTSSYCVHRSKLGHGSKYFDTLFRGSFREGLEKSDRVEIELDPMVAQNFETILQFIYDPTSLNFKDEGRIVDDREADFTIITPGQLIPLALSSQVLAIDGLYTLILDNFKVSYPEEYIPKSLLLFVFDFRIIIFSKDSHLVSCVRCSTESSYSRSGSAVPLF